MDCRFHVKSESQNMDGVDQHHVCNVCGEWFEEALALLAHAESHARYLFALRKYKTMFIYISACTKNNAHCSLAQRILVIYWKSKTKKNYNFTTLKM